MVEHSDPGKFACAEVVMQSCGNKGEDEGVMCREKETERKREREKERETNERREKREERKEGGSAQQHLWFH